MREILFRGKWIDNGEWVEGTPFFACGCCKMIMAMAVHPEFVDEGNVYYAEGYPVDPDTVGQYTGLTDKNGKKIFEGDVVQFTERQLGGKDVPVIEAVEFSEGGFATHRYFLNNWLRDAAKGNCQLQGIEIIGNIHDHPELLKGGEG